MAISHCCSLCDRSFASRSNLRRHVRLHTGQKHSCVVCSMKFARLATLRDHMRCKHPNRVTQRPDSLDMSKLQCAHCKKVFSTGSNLKKHITRKRCAVMREKRGGGDG